MIASHTPEYADGGQAREPLARLFGTLTLGGVGLCGFFVISGYLITASWAASPSWRSYLLKRAARIYPGFLVAWLVSTLVVAPLAGGRWAPGAALAHAVRSVPLLRPPYAEGAFAGAAYPVLNGALWTVAYEARCYLLVPALAAAGVLGRPRVMAVLAAAALAASLAVPPGLDALAGRHRAVELLLGRPHDLLMFTGLFLAGATFRLVERRLPAGRPALGRPAALACLAGFVACLCSPLLAVAGAAVFGTGLVMAAARAGAGTWLARVNDPTDVSYGTYLYGSLFINLVLRLAAPATPLVVVGLAAGGLSALAGWLSWRLVEAPVLRLVRPAA